MTAKHYETATIISNTSDDEIYSLKINAPKITADAKPGQFVMIYLGSDKHLLGRPISLYDVDKHAGTITLDYYVAGEGTKLISQWEEAKKIKLLGPLGNGFDISNWSNVALVGGGVGVAPLHYLAKELNSAGVEFDVYLGFRREVSKLIRCFENFSKNITIATEIGGENNGYVTDFLPDVPEYDQILSCGPVPMLKTLVRYAHSHNIPCQLSVEERMACGIGACKGCVVKTLVGYQLCCQNGPVFDSKEVVWSE